MKWNNNDTKYIIKKLVIYFLIAFAMFIFSTWKASAMTITTGTLDTYTYSLESVETIISISSQLENVGKGNLYFTLLYYNENGNYYNPVTAVMVDSGTTSYICNIGNQVTYNDEGTKRTTIISAVCPVDFSNTGYRGMRIRRALSDPHTKCNLSPKMTFFSEQTSGQTTQQQTTAINNAISSQTQQLLDRLYNNQLDNQNLTSQIIANQNANQQQAHNDAQAINNSINNDNITSGDADDFKNNDAFSDTTGLESVINLPLNMVNSLSNQCVPIQIHIPYLETDATIPCMSTIYRTKFNNLYTLVKLVVNGFLVYRILLKVYELVHEAKQPDEDKLEVIEL